MAGLNRLRAQPVDATPSILTDNGLKPMAFLRRGLVTIRGCKSTSERDQETAATNAYYRFDKHLLLLLLNLACVALTS